MELPGEQTNLPPPPDQTAPIVNEPALAEDARAAAAARVARSVKRTPEEQPAPTTMPAPDADNPYSAFRGDKDNGEVGVLERARLNSIDSYYRGDPTGAGYLRNLASMLEAQRDDKGELPKSLIGPDGRDIKGEYEAIVADLSRYDMLQGFGSTAEAAAALGGQLYGGLTPAALLRVPLGIKWAGTAAGRIAESAVQGGLTNALLDPAAQTLAIEAGVHKEFDWGRAALAGPMGAVIGGGLAGAGQVISSATIRRTRADLAADDPSMKAAGDENATPAPKAQPEEPKAPEAPPEAPPETPTPPPVEETTKQAADTAKNTPPERLPEFTQGAETGKPGEPAGVFQFDAADLATDAKRFQYKEGGDEAGVTTALKGVTKWDAAKANQLIVWQDEAGKLFVADGHQRSGLAKRLLEQGNEQSIRIPGILYRAADGFTPEDVRAIAAAKNIAEGSGSPIDGAKVLRSRPELLDGSMPISRTEARQAFELAKLNDEAFGMVVNEVVPYQHAAVVGRLIPNDGDRQVAAMKALARFEPRNETEATVLVQRVAQSELAKAEAGNQGSMFDDFTSADSTVGDEIRIVAKAIAELKKDKTLFSRVVKDAGRIEETGSTIQRESVQAVAQDAEIFARAITSGAYTVGPLRTALVQAAKDVKNGTKTLNEAVAEVLATARREAERDVRGRAGDSGGAGAAENEGGGLFAIRAPRREGGLANASPEYQRAYADHNAASQEFRKVTDDYRARRIGDDEFLAARAKFNEATKAFDAAFAAEEARPKRGTERNLIAEREAEGQMTLPGAERISAGDLAQRKSDERLTPKTAQKSMDIGLFGDEKDQGSLFLKASSGEQAIAQRQSGGVLAKEQGRPVAGVPSQTGTAVTTVPEPSPQQAGAIRSLQQQAFDFADAIGFPLRQGRVTVRNALGVYKSKSGVVRAKEVPDFEVVAHEAGHAIEGKIGDPLTQLTKQFKSELGPLDYDPQKARVNEGFAEYIRRYIGNPAHAAMVAPGFDTAFKQFMARVNPEMMKSIDDAAAGYRAYLDAPSVDAVASVRRSRDEEPRGWRKLLADMKELGFAGTIKTAMDHSYTALFDDKAPVARAVRDLAVAIKEKTGNLVELKAANDPEKLMRLFGRWEQAGILDMMKGVRPAYGVTPEGPSLSSALVKATGQPSVFGKWDTPVRGQFSDYMIARRAALLWDKFDQGGLPNPPVAFSKADAVVAMTELERANPQFREASDMVHAYTRELLKKSYEGHLIGADLYEQLLKEEFYVPFMRDLSDRPLAGGDTAARGGMDRTADVVQRMRGSSRDIKDPIESLMMQTYLVNRTLKHNNIIRSFVDLAKRAGPEGGRFVEPIPANEASKYTFDLGAAIERVGAERNVPPDDMKVMMGALTDVFGEDPLVGSFFRMEPAGKRGEPIVFYKDGGELKAARFMSGEEGHALYETLTQLPTAISDLGLKLLSTSSTVLRSGVTSNPVYALTNYIRDQVAVGIIRPDYIPFISGTKGIRAEVKGGESAQLYGYAGGVSAGAAIAPIKQASDSNVDALAKQGYLVNRLSSLDGLLQLTSITEAGTRNSVFDTVYKAKRREGLSEYEAMIEAAYSAQDILDFSRWGSKTMAVRALTPFVNAWAQGMDKAKRTMIDPLVKEAVFATDPAAKQNAITSLTKAVGVGAALGAAWAAIHHDDEIYQDAKASVKGNHFVTSVGGKVVVIPKPFELSIGFTAGEFAYQLLMKNDPRAAEQFAEAAFEVLKPPMPVFSNPLIKTPFELTANYSTFTGRAIVPDRMSRLKPEQQYTDRTSSAAKAIGGVIGVSPIKVDYAVGNMFGLWGRDVMAMSSGVDDDAPAQSLEDRVFWRRFIKDPTRSSDVTTTFWNFMGRTTGKYNQAVATYDDLVRRRSPEGDAQAAELLAKMKDGERAFVTLKSAADEDGRPAFKADHKRLHPLQRAYDAVTVLNGLRSEMSNNSFAPFESGERLVMTREARRDLLENVRELAQREMRNALVIMKEPGFANRQLAELDPTLAKIRALSPQVADEIKTRYATSRIYTTEQVARQYDTLKSSLIRYGGSADVDDLVDIAKEAGYEFSGDRVKRPQKRRIPIPAK